MAQVMEAEDTEFTKGYLYCKLEERFGADVELDIQGDRIIVYNWPDDVYCEDIKLCLGGCNSLPVEFDRSYRPVMAISGPVEATPTEVFEEGGFLPELNPFFPTMLAKPHIVGYSVGYRSYDKIFKTSCLPVSIGDQFSIFQLKDICPGRLYVGIEACVWSIFEAKPKSLYLINADYYVAIPLTYIQDGFFAKFSIYHQSSHLGDEYLLENPQIRRVNPSMEVVDVSVAYDFGIGLTTFAGYSHVLRSDDGFHIQPIGFYYGFNYYLDYFKVNVCNVQAVPYMATYFLNLEENRWRLDSYGAVGYEWNKCYGHKVRIYLEAHDGFSPDGQFAKERTRYIALKLLYGY